MIKIIRAGKAENGLSLPLCRCLSDYGLIHFNGESLTQSGIENPEFLFIEAQTLEFIQTQNAIILYDGSAKTSFCGCGRLLIVTDYALKDTVSYQNELGIITCGVCDKNAISLSSVNESCALIAINETVTTLSGGEIYPCEISVTLTHPIETQILVKIAAILILSDKIQNEHLTI